MRHLAAWGLMILMSGIASAAESGIDPNAVFDSMGLTDSVPDPSPDTPEFGFDVPESPDVEPDFIPVPEDSDGGLGFDSASSSQFPELPGLGTFTEYDDEIELPGIDGLPIRPKRAQLKEFPEIPGFDGLPLGMGSRN